MSSRMAMLEELVSALSSIRAVDIVLFVLGFGVGMAISYFVGKWVFNVFFKRQAKAITVEATAYFEAIQQAVSYALGFMMGGALLDPRLMWTIFAVWIAALSFLAVKIFGFSSIGHGFTFAGIDTAGDMFIGGVFGTSTAAFTLLKLTLAPI